MTKKPDLTLISTTPITELPKKSADDIQRWIKIEGLKVSEALRNLIKKNNYPKPDSSVPIQLLEFTYPRIDLNRNSFRFKITDADYPNSDPKQFSDQNFDEVIETLISNPTEC